MKKWAGCKVIDTRSKTAIAQIEYCVRRHQSWRHGDSVRREAGDFVPCVRCALTASCQPHGKAYGTHRHGERTSTRYWERATRFIINVGSNQGVKIGDYFRAVRSYEADLKDPVDSLSFRAAIAEDTQKKTPSVDPETV